MRILAVSMSARPHGIGGMEDHLHTLTEELARRGHEVSVITGRHPDGLESETIDGVRWTYVDSAPHWLDPAWAPELERAVHAQLAEGDFDVIHSQSSSALPLLWRRREGLPPIVLSLHGNYVSIVNAAVRHAVGAPNARSFARALRSIVQVSRMHFAKGNWRLFRRCEASVPSRSQVRPSRWSHLLRRGHVHVVRSGVDTRVFHPREQLAERKARGVAPEVPVALYVGRLDHGKGPQVAIEALARLTDVPGAQLILVGDGPRRDENVALAERLGVGSRVHFVGRLTPEAVAEYMSAADVLVFPTLLAEAGPLVVAQALATGTPVVASRIGAVPEMVTDGESGVLVKPGKPDELAAALRRLFTDPGLRAQMGENGRQAALAGMTVERMTDAMTEVYERARRDSGVRHTALSGREAAAANPGTRA
jgi:glycosyltransferase involved in cell wall biosynthesis